MTGPTHLASELRSCCSWSFQSDFGRFGLELTNDVQPVMGVWRRRSDVQVRGTSQPAARDCCSGSPLYGYGVGRAVGRIPETAAGPMGAVVCRRTTEEEHYRGHSSGRRGR